MFIVVDGNIADGFQFYGPFDDAEDAELFCGYTLDSDEWNICELQSPKSLDEKENDND